MLLHFYLFLHIFISSNPHNAHPRFLRLVCSLDHYESLCEASCFHMSLQCTLVSPGYIDLQK